MKLKGALGGIALMMALGVFYTFAFIMVEDVDDNIISAEYYYSTETEAAETTVTVREKNVHKEPQKQEAAVTETTSVTEKERFDDVDVYESDAAEEAVPTFAEVTTVPETDELLQTEAVSAETIPEEENYLEEDIDETDELDRGSTEALEQSVYGTDSDGGRVISSDDDQETETSAETVSVETTEPQYDDSNDIVISFFDGDANNYDPWAATETSVSVNVGNIGDVSTSETFTAKINGSAQTVNAYDLICQIVANEMSPSFSDEALKAQAVAAYSYVKYHNVNGLTPSVLVKKNPSDRVKELVSEVWGVCCYYNGNVAQTVYMASSSGYTADAVNVWGGAVPYLKSVYCPFDVTDDPNYGDTMNVSESSMRNMLESCLGITLSGDPQSWLVITDYVDGNYVYEISVDGQKTISGRKLRENVMGHKLKSAAFDVYYSDGYFHFTTYGYGHGVGMSQNGANILAKQGYSYVDILKYYFTGIEVI